VSVKKRSLKLLRQDEINTIANTTKIAKVNFWSSFLTILVIMAILAILDWSCGIYRCPSWDTQYNCSSYQS